MVEYRGDIHEADEVSALRRQLWVDFVTVGGAVVVLSALSVWVLWGL
jgi:hypothetical protein